MQTGHQLMVGRSFVRGVGRSFLAGAIALGLWLGVATESRAEKSCPPECEECRKKGGAWYNNFCFLPIQPDKNVLSDMDVDDPVLT
jgi:hypothetical protein